MKTQERLLAAELLTMQPLVSKQCLFLLELYTLLLTADGQVSLTCVDVLSAVKKHSGV